MFLVKVWLLMSPSSWPLLWSLIQGDKSSERVKCLSGRQVPHLSPGSPAFSFLLHETPRGKIPGSWSPSFQQLGSWRAVHGFSKMEGFLPSKVDKPALARWESALTGYSYPPRFQELPDLPFHCCPDKRLPSSYHRFPHSSPPC